MIEFSLDRIDTKREIKQATLSLYRIKFADSVGYDNTEEVSSVRELYRTEFINIDESYFIWYPNYWQPLLDAGSELIDTFDAEDNMAKGWEHYDITEVVKDSLGSERNRVNLMLKMRNEKKSYNRLATYAYESDDTTNGDISGIDPEKVAQYPKVTIVYKNGDALLTEKHTIQLTGVMDRISLFALNGQLIRTFENRSIETVKNNVTGDISPGAYVLRWNNNGQTGKLLTRF